MDTEKIKRLLQKQKSDQLTAEEKAILDTWYLKLSQTETVSIDETDMATRLDVVWAGLDVNRELKRGAYLFNLIRISSAAAIVLMIGGGLFYYYHDKKETHQQFASNTLKNDIVPGGNKAILTLADGQKISLTDANNGTLAEQSGIKITKAADGKLIYTISDLPSRRPGLKSQVSNLEYNTIETPKGGQYQVILPDGSKVWLNAASSLKYPASFASLKERKVQLNGEAYFEVSKDKSHPFVVNTVNQEIEVLGTHFNVNAYTDEASVKTTLLEGSVKVYIPGTNSPLGKTGVRLKPGQQSVLTGNGLSVSEGNTEEAIAWKNGYFRFDDEKLESIMRKIARWYDVDVTYQNDTLKNELFWVVTTRFANMSQLVKMMEKTGDVKFNIEDGKIIVSKKRK